jgi:hypothetical protein
VLITVGRGKGRGASRSCSTPVESQSSLMWGAEERSQATLPRLLPRREDWLIVWDCCVFSLERGRNVLQATEQHLVR